MGKIIPKPTPAMIMFKTETEKALAETRKVIELRSDPYIDFVFKVAETLFTEELDVMGVDWLIRHGGRLSGIYAFLGNKAAQARAERDIYQQKAEEVESALITRYYGESDSKVTLARARVKQEMAAIHELVIEKDAQKNAIENVQNAGEKMISFIQSAIKVKTGEQYRSTAIQDNF